MADIATARAGGYKCLQREAIPVITAATQIFKNAPPQTCLILMSVRSQSLTMTFENTAPTAGGTGHTYGVPPTQAPYEFFLTDTEAKKAKAIQDAATCSGELSYWGINTGGS